MNLRQPHGHYHSPLAVATVLSDIDSIEYMIENDAEVDLRLEHGKHGSTLAFVVATAIDNLEDRLP